MIKRESEERNGGETKKRRVLDELSEDGPLTQEDVVYYQKEAILRKLNLYKEESFILKKESRLLNTECETYKTRLLLLSSWVDQFLEFVAALAPTENGTNATIELFLDTPNPLDGNSDDILKQLNAKKVKLGEIIQNIAVHLPSDISESLASINKQFQNVKVKYDSLKSSHKLLGEKYDSLAERHQTLFKQHQRLQSKTIQRVIGQRDDDTKDSKDNQQTSNSHLNTTPSSVDSKTNNHVANETNNNSNDNDTQTRSKSISNTGSIDVDKLHQLQSQIDESKAIIDAQRITIQENIERFQNLHTHLLNGDATVSSKESIENSEAYKSVQKQNQELESKHEEYMQRLELLEHELKESKDQLQSCQESLVVFNQEKSTLEKELSDTKEKEERLRNERDLSMTEAELWKHKNNFKTLNDLQELVNAQGEQIKSFDLETKLNQLVPSDSEKDVSVLQKKNAVLLAEIKEMETAFKQLQSVRIPKVMNAVEEEKRKKDLDAAKIKVDHKYRALMQGDHYQKTNGEKLQSTFKVLKTSFEKIETQQGEYKKQIDQLNSEIVELRKLLHTKELETKEYHQRCNKFEDTVKTETAQVAKIQQDFNILKTEYQALLRKESDEAQELAASKSKIVSQEKLIARYKSTGSLDDSSEIDSFRSLLYCSLCSKNWKNTAIKTCGHVFCDSCAKERLAARMRKCPSCNKQFSTNDLLTIHL